MPNTPVLGLPYPALNDSADVPRDIEALAMGVDVLGVVPVGSVVMWMGAAAPSGWLLLNGQVVSAAQYPGLAAIFGESGGNVTLPDMRDRFPAGASATQALGSVGGEASHLLTAAEAAQKAVTSGLNSAGHTHTLGGLPFLADIAGGLYLAGSGARQGAVQSAATGGVSANHTHAIAGSNATAAHENRPPYRAVNFIIKAG